MANSKIQGRIWGKVLYSEDFPKWDDLVERLRNTHIQIMISPEHEPDEEEKKKHRHILMFYESNQTNDSVNETLSTATGRESKYVLKENSKRGSIRYLIHRDHPHKQQFITEHGEYDIQAIQCLNGCEDMRDQAFADTSNAEWEANFIMIQDVIDDYAIDNIVELRAKLMELGYHSLVRDLHDYNPYYLNMIMTGYYQMKRRVQDHFTTQENFSRIKDRKEMLQ